MDEELEDPFVVMRRGWRDVWVVRLLRLGGGGREGENGLEDGMQEVRGEKGYRTMVGVVGVGAASSTSTAARGEEEEAPEGEDGEGPPPPYDFAAAELDARSAPDPILGRNSKVSHN